ncbi:MAG: glycosyltransferase family 2 protein [Nanoarchaeota archaeon]
MEDINKVSVVIPCYNEEKIIDNTYNLVKKVLNKTKKKYEIIISSDGSKDKTNEILRKISIKDKMAHIIINKKNRGMGYVLRQMFNKASGNVVIQMDADLSVNPNIINSFLEEIKNYDVVIASRYKGIKGEIPLTRLIASRVYHIFNFFFIWNKDT